MNKILSKVTTCNEYNNLVISAAHNKNKKTLCVSLTPTKIENCGDYNLCSVCLDYGNRHITGYNLRIKEMKRKNQKEIDAMNDFLERNKAKIASLYDSRLYYDILDLCKTFK